MSSAAAPEDKLVRMANQIAQFFQSQPHDEAVAGIADHLRSFWTPKMRRQIADHVAAGGAGLGPLTLEAVRNLQPAAQQAFTPKEG
jgi:formate dehydrogenase subunit delta